MGSHARTALIADDDPFFRIALSSILRESLGFAEVVQTGSLDEALDVLGSRAEVGLALFDLAMPGMTDAGSLRAVRECFPELTTVVVSGSQRRDDVLLALQAGVHGFVPKAAGVDELVGALTAIVGGWIYVPPFIARIGPAELGTALPVAVAPATTPHEGIDLTPRQGQILDLIVAGQSNKTMARNLGVSEGTVKVHVAALLRALGVPNRSAAAAWGARQRSA
jgi:DNA-binding NarL/FixJ family response regulator